MYQHRLATVVILACLIGTQCVAGEVTSEDAAVRWDSSHIEIETAAVAHRLDVSSGALRRIAWVDRKTGVDLLQNRPIEDFRLLVNGGILSSATPGWRIEPPVCKKLDHGELQLSLELTRDDLRIVRHYRVYPGISLVRGWLEITMLGTSDLVLGNPPLACASRTGSTRCRRIRIRSSSGMPRI